MLISMNGMSKQPVLKG